jgi:hypothetical protein
MDILLNWIEKCIWRDLRAAKVTNYVFVRELRSMCYCTGNSGNFSDISGPPFSPPNKGPIGYSETSVRNDHYPLRNSPEEHSSHLLRWGNLKSRIRVYSWRPWGHCSYSHTFFIRCRKRSQFTFKASVFRYPKTNCLLIDLLIFYVVRTVHFGMKLYNDQRNAQVLMYLSIYFCLTCFGFSFSPSSVAGVQLRQWF